MVLEMKPFIGASVRIEYQSVDPEFLGGDGAVLDTQLPGHAGASNGKLLSSTYVIDRGGRSRGGTNQHRSFKQSGQKLMGPVRDLSEWGTLGGQQCRHAEMLTGQAAAGGQLSERGGGFTGPGLVHQNDDHRLDLVENDVAGLGSGSGAAPALPPPRPSGRPQPWSAAHTCTG